MHPPDTLGRWPAPSTPLSPTPGPGCAGLPKAELHLHLEGSITPATLLELSRTNDATPLTAEQARAVYTYHDFPSFLMSFKAVTERLHTPADYETITYDMLRDLSAQGVRHAEAYISIGILYHFGRFDVDEVMAAIERGRIRGEQDFGVSLLWIIDAVRHFGVEECARVFSKAAELRHRYPSVVGIGIGGDEARGPAHDFREMLRGGQGRGSPPDLPCRRGGRAAEHLGGAEHRRRADRARAHRAAGSGPDRRARRAADSAGAQRHLQPPDRLLCLARGRIRFAATSKRGLWLRSTRTTRRSSARTCSTSTSWRMSASSFRWTPMRELAANSIEASFLPPERKLDLLGRGRALRLVIQTVVTKAILWQIRHTCQTDLRCTLGNGSP